MSPPIVKRRQISGPLRSAEAEARQAERPFGLENPFIREIAKSLVIGFGAAAVFLAVILAMDLAHLRSLGMASQAGVMALGLLFVFSGLTFASAQTAFSILLRAKGDEIDDDDGPGPIGGA
ncbi:MAG: hypothetical protein AAGM38_13175 [Pseudomonadota bacterium]